MYRRAAVAFAFALFSSLASAQGQTPWPTRPVTMVVPFAAGGPMDTVARIAQSGMNTPLDQQVVIENVGGGGGMIASARVAKAAPDGYQFVIGNVGTHAVSQSLFKHPPFNVTADFAPVALLADLSMVLIARKDLPVNNLKEFIAYAKANQDKMQFASAGAGSATHLACVLLNAAAGINVTHVPYRGGAPAMQDLVAGRIDYFCTDVPLAIPQIESGAIKGLALLGRNRSASLPNLPTAQEQGLAGFEASNWAALFLPKGTPAPIVGKLHDAAVASLNNADVQKRFKENGVDVVTPDRRSPEYLAKFVAAEIAKWAGPVKAAGVVQD